jgi:hypothetical protein
MSEANDNPGLLASAAAEEEQTTEGQEQSISHVETPANTEEDDGPLERPDFWPEKFWKKDSNEPDLEGLSKSYSELEKQFRAGKHKAPEGGNYNMDALAGVPEDDALAKTYVSWAQKYGLSQAAFDELASQFVQMGGVQQQEMQRSMEAELEELGPNAKAVIANMATWGKGLVQKGIFSKEDFNEFARWGDTARGIKALMKLRETYEGRVPVETIKTVTEDSFTADDLAAAVANPEYKTNPAYRAKIERLVEKMHN